MTNRKNARVRRTTAKAHRVAVAKAKAPAKKLKAAAKAIAKHRRKLTTQQRAAREKAERAKRKMDQVSAALAQERTRLMDEWQDIKMACDKARRVLLWGPPGTGKSYMGTSVPREKLFRLYITMDTPAAEVRGHYLPNDNGGFSWHDGPGISAWRKGGRLVIDEIDSASGDTLTLLMGLLDDPETAKLTLPTNETIVPADGFSVVATTNQSPTVMPEALLDRFDVVLYVEKPAPWAFDPAGWHNAKLAQAAERALLLTSGNKPKGRGNRPIGLRAFKAIDRLQGSAEMSFETATRLVVGPEAARWLATAITLSR